MNCSRYPRWRFLRTALLATCLTAFSSVTAFGKDLITDANSTGPIEVGFLATTPVSVGDFNVRGPYLGPGGTTIPWIDLIVTGSSLGEWWVNASVSDPWTALVFEGTLFAYHHRGDVPDGGTFWAAWSLEAQYFDYTSAWQHSDGQIPNGSIISFGLSDSGNPYPTDLAVWNFPTFSGMSDVDVAGGLDLSTYPGPDVADFSGAPAFSWLSYEVTDGAAGGVPSGTDISWTIKTPTAPITDYVVFVELPPGESIDADGRSFTELTATDMQGLGATDEIVFNWTIDAKSDTIGEPNPAYGENVGGTEPCTLEFTDGAGGTPVYQVGDTLFIEGLDEEANADSGAPDTVTVTLTNTRTGETETVTLTETGNDTNLFTIVGGFPTTDTGSTGNDDGTLNVQPGDTVTASALTGGTGVPCTATYRFPVPADIQKSVDKTEAGEGDTLNYSIDLNYPAGDVLTDVTVTDAVPTGTTYVASSATAGGTEAGGTVTWNLGSTVAGTGSFVLPGQTPFGALDDATDDLGAADSINPAVAIDANGALHVVFEGMASGASKINIYYMNDVGGAWSVPVLLSDDSDGQDALDPDIAIDGSGTAHVVWVDKSTSAFSGESSNDGRRNIYYRSITSGGTLSSPLRLSDDTDGQDGRNPAVAVTSGGTASVVFTDKSTAAWSGESANDGGRNVYLLSVSGGTAGSPVRLSDDTDGQDAIGPDVAVDSTGTAHVVFNDIPDAGWTGLAADDSNRNVYYRSVAGTTASAPTRLSDDTDGQDALEPAVAVDGGGAAHVAYTDKQSDDAKRNVYYTNNTSGSFLVSEDVTADFSGQDSFDPAIAIDRLGTAHLAFENTGTDGGKVDIFYANNSSGNFDTPEQFTTDLDGQNSLNPAIAVDANSICLVFDARDPSDTKRNIYNTCADILVGTSMRVSANPAIGTTGDTVTVTVEMTATEDLTAVLPVLTEGATNNMGLSLVSSPAAQDLTAGVAAQFVWTYTITEGAGATPGQLTFQATATNNDAILGLVDFGTADANSLIATPPLEFEVTVGAGAPNPIENTASISDTTGFIPPTESNTVETAPLNSIGDLVWVDSDGDGVQDGTESGLAGVTVNLLDGSGDPVLDGGVPVTTTTSDGTTDVDGDGNIDPAGSYYFGDLPDGNYIVEFEAPAGYEISPQDSGTDEAVDSDADPMTGQTEVISLSGGTAVDTVDAGLYEPVTVEGSVLVNDGAGDQPLGGVTLILLDGNGDPVLDGGGQPVTTTSDPVTGAYSFEGLPPGTYQVGQLQPDGYVSTTDTDGANNNLIGDQNPITLASGQTSSGNDFVETTAPPTGAIGNYVWLDENGDGIQDAGEAGIPGVTVNLRDGGGSIIATTTTDANGGYLFTGLAAGSYTVEVDGPSLPTGLNLTGDPDVTLDGQHAVTLGADEEYLSADFGYNFVPAGDSDTPGPLATGAIGDRVWNDANGDGVQDPGEAGIAGVTVTLLTDDNGDGIYGGAGDTAVPPITTDVHGNYIFDGLAPGSYVVEVTAPSGYTQTGDPDGTPDNKTTSPVVVAPGDVFTNADFGYDLDSGGAGIGDTIYLDVNGTGSHDPGTDIGLPGVTVALLDASGNVIATDITDENGNYSFPGLPTGVDYTVVVTDTNNVLGGLEQSGDPDGGNDGQSTVLALPALGDETQDFGYVPAGHGSGDGIIGDTVFIDLDGSNGPDTGEGVEGVTVELYDASGTVLLATTTTNENGNYAFGGLDPAGTYTVVVDPTGTILAGMANSVDPDTGGDSTSVVDLSLTAGVNADQDFGYVPAGSPNTIGGTVWNDTNADGTLNDGGTSGIPGVTVVLRDPAGNVVATTTTDGNGDYSFPNLPDGTYTVDVTDDGNVLDGAWHSDGPNDGIDGNSQDDPYSVTVSGGASDTSGDFGYYSDPASLGNFVFDDLDADGIQDPGEPGIGGVTVTLTIAYPTGDTVTVTTTTAVDGSYSFDNLLADESFAASGGVGEPTHTVTVATPAGSAPTVANQGGDDTIDSDNGLTGELAELVQGATDDSNDFGFVPTGAIGNYVWLDEDGDGVQDAGEAGLPGITVNLRNSGGTIIATTTTDLDGGYLFTDVAPGDYTVEVDAGLLPSGLSQTGDPDATLDGQYAVTLAPGEEQLDADFGYNYVPLGDPDTPGPLATGAIGDRVWNDANGDGVQDPGEAGIAGVTVTLLTDDNGDGIYGGAGDTAVPPITTDVHGNYIFDDLAPGSYVVEVTAPSGYTQTGDPDGTPDNRTTSPVVVAPGDVFTNADFGYDLLSGGAAIGDTVYLDVNGNGSHDPGTDVGIAGVTVALEDAAGNVIATDITDGNGNYEFPGLPTGVDYTVVVTDTNNLLGVLEQIGDPDGGNDGQSTVTALGVLGDDTQDFGYGTLGHGPGDGVIGDTVFLDRDASGTPDAGEGVEAVTVELYDASGVTLLAETTTDENGNYIFGGLDPAGTYTVKVDTAGTVLTGAGNTVDPDGGNDGQSQIDLSATGGINLDQDFGYEAAAPNTIGGTVWEDANADGTLNEGASSGIPGVTVVLRDAWGQVVATTITDSNGDYSFDGLPDGTYTVDVTDDGNVLNGAWHSDGPNDGADSNSQDDPYSVTVSGGATDTSGDFGYYRDPAGLGNFVFDDLDGDGIQDGGEPGIPGVVVTLTITYPNGGTVVVTTTTAADGSYGFDGLLDESFTGSGGVGEPTYTVTVANPSRYLPSPSDQGGDPAKDSDGSGVEATLVQGATDDTYDFGFVKQKATNYDDFITDAGLTPGTSDGQPLPDGGGTGGNPDDDWASNLLEHAFCDTPNSGIPNHLGFCVELTNAATGQMDASFIRAEGVEDVIYTLQGSDSMLGPWFDIGTIPAGAAASGGFTAVSNGDGTETVTYANVQNDAGYTASNFGFTRLCVSLDSEPNGIPDIVILPSDGSSVVATDYTRSFGWQCVPYNQGQCASFSHPFSNKPAVTGTVTGNTHATATVDVSGSLAAGDDLATLNLGPIDLDPPNGQFVATHYLQVTSGPREGERWDIASASGGVLTIGNDPDIFAAGDGVSSLNTSDGVPADGVLAGSSFQVLPHKTIDQLFDKNGAFAGLESASDETRLLFYNSRIESPGFETLSLATTVAGVKWIALGDSNEIDQGPRPVDRCMGNYIHSLVGPSTVCSVGLVADYDIACPFNEGYNLAGAVYPINQTATGVNGRDMQIGSAADEFRGWRTPSQSTEIFLWMGDMAVDQIPTPAYMEGYETFMAADDGGAFKRWVDANDPTLADLGVDENGALLLLSWRAATVKMLPGYILEPHLYPLPVPLPSPGAPLVDGGESVRVEPTSAKGAPGAGSRLGVTNDSSKP